MYLTVALGARELEDQHVLGQPALVAGHDRRDPQREALLAQQRVAAVARSRRTRSRASRGSGRCTSPRCTATAPDVSPSASGAPTVCRQGTKSPSSPSTSSAPLPIRVMIRIDHRDVGGVGELDADLGDRRAQRAHAERDDVHASGRASRRRTCRRARSRMSAGSRQLLVGPASSLALRADERAVLDPRDVARIGARQVRVRPLGVRELLERSRLYELSAQRVVLLRGAVAPVDRRRLRQLGDLLDPGEELACVSWGRGSRWSLVDSTSLGLMGLPGHYKPAPGTDDR